MIRQAFQSLVNLCNWHLAPKEVKEHCLDTVSKLRTSTKSDRSVEAPASNSHGASNKVVSLFEAMPRTEVRERKSIGHWCNQSAAAAREERLVKIERSYESDFRSAVSTDVVQLESYLSKNNKHSALNSYINRAKGSPNASNFVIAESDFLYSTIGQVSSEQNDLHSEHDELLFKLAQDVVQEIRLSVASNMHAPVPAMWLLSDDESAAVRLALVDNETLPLSILEKLGNDLDGRIARRAQSKLRKISSMEEGIAFGNLSSKSESSNRGHDLCTPETDIAV